MLEFREIEKYRSGKGSELFKNHYIDFNTGFLFTADFETHIIRIGFFIANSSWYFVADKNNKLYLMKEEPVYYV